MTIETIAAVKFYSACAAALAVIGGLSWYFKTWWPVYVLVGFLVIVGIAGAMFSKQFNN